MSNIGLEMISASSAMPLRLKKPCKKCSYSMTGRVENEQNAGRVKHLSLSGGVSFRTHDPICCVLETYGLLFLRPCPFMVLVSLSFVESLFSCRGTPGHGGIGEEKLWADILQFFGH